MLLEPPVLALQLISALVSLALLTSVGFAVRVVRHWDLSSGSELQLRLEHRTYLVSTTLQLAFLSEVISLLLFVYTVEALSSRITGAMCATGTLNATPFGFPALALKLVVFLAAALWLLLDHLDRRGYDCPLVVTKYGLLLLIAPLALAETTLQTLHFGGLRPEVITSCCGSLFSAEGSGVAPELAALPVLPSMAAFYTSGGFAIGAALLYLRTGRGATAVSTLGALALGIALPSIVSFVSVYVYESPHHHCPFCLLKGGYDYVGYGLYASLLGGAVCALGTGLSAASGRRCQSLTVPGREQARRCALATTLLLAAFYALATWAVTSSHLVLSWS